MRIGKEKEVVEVEPKVVPFEGDEVQEEKPKKKKEKKEPVRTGE